MHLNRSVLRPHPLASSSRSSLVLVLRPGPRSPNRARARGRRTKDHALRGMTLAEVMVAVAIASLVLGLVALASMTASHWFAAVANYVDMDAQSRNALDQMTLKIRQAGGLTEFSPTHLKFALPGQTNSFLVYDWDSASGSLMECNTG